MDVKTAFLKPRFRREHLYGST